MTQVAILTPDPAEIAYPELWPKVLARLQLALDQVGIDSVPMPWTAHIDDASALRRFVRVLPLLAWGYHHVPARWLTACATWQRDRVAISNPAAILAWNTDKRYLLELARRGVAMPETLCTDQVSETDLAAMFSRTGAEELIVKPAISGGAWKTRRLRPGEAIYAGGMAMLVQPYLPSIESEGETSLLYFGGRLSHVVNKRPMPGDFRVQEEFGGIYTVLETAPAGALALAEQVLAAIEAPLLYARIDMVPDADGRWLLMEAELIEPDFYLAADPARGACFAHALREAIDRE